MEYRIPLDEQRRILGELDARTDAEAARMKRYLAMPDLARTPGSPIGEIIQEVRGTKTLKGFDDIAAPEVVPADVSFDLFDFPPDHPARRRSDTYYVDDAHILRTHTTVMWYYYTQLPEIKERIARREKLGVVSYGKVYRKDEIDSKHMNVFHQIDGWYLTPADTDPLSIDDLRNVLSEIVKAVFGEQVHYRFLDDAFPFTDPSLQVEIWVGPGAPSTESSDDPGPDGGRWMEVLGGGMTKQAVFKELGIEGYNAWAFGFGLERLAMISTELPDIRLLWSTDPRVTKQLHMGTKFVEVSKYPPALRDISFIVPKTFSPNDYFDLVRDIAGDLVELVELIDQYENDAKFGADKKSYAYRITYRAGDRTLTNEEVDALHKKIEEGTVKEFGATVR